jgi:hyperosmotically inducible periplasmic protein
MFSTRTIRHVIVAVAAAGAMTASAAGARTVGQVIDDSRITTEVKGKLVADKVSNLTRITVKTEDGIVYLSGDVDTPERRDRATQSALDVKGVKQVVNNVRVTGTSGSSPSATAAPSPAPPPAPPAPAGATSSGIPQGSALPSPPVDATGTVASVDPGNGTITLEDGRVLRATVGTAVWTGTTIQSLQPGTRVFLRGAQPVDFREAIMPRASWRMGTVSRVDTARNLIILTDGTTIRVSPSTTFQVWARRLTLADLEPGSEIVIRTPLSPASGPAEARGSTTESAQIGGAAPREDLPYPTIDASEVREVWAPSMR